jgi:hypothetical protein
MNIIIVLLTSSYKNDCWHEVAGEVTEFVLPLGISLDEMTKLSHWLGFNLVLLRLASKMCCSYQHNSKI